MSKIAVAMSGGVDSSVTAALLKNEGHDVTGIHMRLFPGHGSSSDAEKSAAHLGIPFHEISLEHDFCRLVIEHFRASYSAALTPNPCVRCNMLIKFGKLLDFSRSVGAEIMATGHYVRTYVDAGGTTHLLKACNLKKDQSYFLYALSQDQLKSAMFPLGRMESKEQVRSIARQMALPVAEKCDSQEICFVPGDDYTAFLESSEEFTASDGEIIHLDGMVLGRHNGIHRFTIGQRKGLGIAWKEPLYVIAIDSASGRVVVGEKRHLLADALEAGEVNWILPPSEFPFRTSCKIRYRHEPVECSVSLSSSGKIRVAFDSPQHAVTPGQSVVFYDDEEVIGGGIITKALHDTITVET